MFERAFEPYVTTKPRGTGLGLAIVRKIIEEHGGGIELSNISAGEAGVAGACVTVRLSKLAKSDENRDLIATPSGLGSTLGLSLLPL